jgi:hypothetical protein
MQKKKLFQLFLKGLITIYFFYVTRKFVIDLYFSPHVYYTFFTYFSIVRLDVDIHFLSCIISMNIGI